MTTISDVRWEIFDVADDDDDTMPHRYDAHCVTIHNWVFFCNLLSLLLLFLLYFETKQKYQLIHSLIPFSCPDVYRFRLVYQWFREQQRNISNLLMLYLWYSILEVTDRHDKRIRNVVTTL